MQGLKGKDITLTTPRQIMAKTAVKLATIPRTSAVKPAMSTARMLPIAPIIPTSRAKMSPIRKVTHI